MGRTAAFANARVSPATPLAVVDLAAVDDNADDLVRRAAGRPIRVASKSVRCRTLLERVLATPGWHGVMSYTLPEAIWLVRAGVTDDVLVATGDQADEGQQRAWWTQWDRIVGGAETLEE